MNAQLFLSLSLVCLALTGCTTDSLTAEDSQPQPEAIASDVDPEPVEQQPEADVDDSSPSGTVDSTLLISEDGFGLAQLGMTLGELKQALPPDTEYVVHSPFMVDFDAITVQQGGTELFHILYFAGDTFTDDSIIQGMMTDSPAYQTAEGIGVETQIQIAEAAYGNATLSYSWANEGREYVRFDNPPASNLSFRVWRGDAPSVDFVGIYPSNTAEYNETQEYIEGGEIKAI